MRQKELRIALVCYGGVSLAVYMHGVTKEVWKLARASRDFHSLRPKVEGVQDIYRELLETIERDNGLRLRILPDILSGASAGGINAVFLAQALHSGQSLEPLTDLWLDGADVERLLDPDARPMWRFTKFWAQPIVWWLLTRPGSGVSESVAPETQSEVRRKVSGFIRGRWFEPPFSGAGLSHQLYDALQSMEESGSDGPLLPPGHPIDLYVTTTDFRGFRGILHLNSPPTVEESEHRMPIGFSAQVPVEGGHDVADRLELILAARATASFPGAFPPLQLAEIDELAIATDRQWPGRKAFVERTMPVHVREGNSQNVALIDGSVLNNAPFEGAIQALHGRPVQREVDRRFVYIDPHPDTLDSSTEEAKRPVGFFSAILGSLSAIPREQPIRDNLEVLEERSREAQRLERIVSALRPEVERSVEKLFGHTLFLDKPTPKRLKAWRNKAQNAAVDGAGYAFHSYAQAKFTGIVEQLGQLALDAAPQLSRKLASVASKPIVQRLLDTLEERGLHSLVEPSGSMSDDAIAFFRAHDLGFRIRRLRLLVRRLARDWENDPEISDQDLEQARDVIYAILALYFAHDGAKNLGPEFSQCAEQVMEEPGLLLDRLGQVRLLPEVDEKAEEMLAEALEKMPKNLRRRMLLTYLGFPFYDVATLPLLKNEGLTEFDEVKVDRISPDDARSIREGGTRATLRGTELYSFGAFFSRAYRENDYLWGRLHGAERMIDLICSTVDTPVADGVCQDFKRRAFLKILDEEQERLSASSDLLASIRQEIEERLG